MMHPTPPRHSVGDLLKWIGIGLFGLALWHAFGDGQQADADEET